MTNKTICGICPMQRDVAYWRTMAYELAWIAAFCFAALIAMCICLVFGGAS